MKPLRVKRQKFRGISNRPTPSLNSGRMVAMGTPTVPAASSPVVRQIIGQSSKLSDIASEDTPLLYLLSKYREIRLAQQSVIVMGSEMDSAQCVTVRENILQLFRTPVGWAGRHPPTTDENIENAKFAAREHCKAIEYTLFVGAQPYRDEEGTSRMGGVAHWLKPKPLPRKTMTLMQEISNYPDLMTWGEGGSRTGSATKYLFLPRDVYGWSLNGQPVECGEYRGPFGTLKVIPCQSIQNHAVVLDMNHVRLVAFKDRELQFRTWKNPANDVDEAEWLSDLSLDISCLEAHTVLQLSEWVDFRPLPEPVDEGYIDGPDAEDEEEGEEELVSLYANKYDMPDEPEFERGDD